MLNDMADTISGPWVLVGDFNEINSSNEKRGGRSVGQTSSQVLQNFIEHSGCIDLEFVGNPYTWTNNITGLANVRQRLDKALINDSCRIMFPKAGVMHLPFSHSNHNPLLLKL